MGPPPWLPAAFGGFDRYDPPSPKWMEVLLHKSNFSFAWHYLSHWPRPKGEGVTWKKAFPKLHPQGWGFVLTYVPLSQRRQNVKNTTTPDDTSWITTGWEARELAGVDMTGVAKTRGIEHAKLLKKFAKELGHEVQGAVVMVDNEDQDPNPNIPSELLRPAVLAYYEAIFDEMRTLGEEKIAFRPGLYSRPKPLEQFLAHSRNNQDLHLWKCDLSYDSNNIPYRIFDQSNDRLYTPIETHPCKSVTYNYAQVGRTALTLGRQWVFYKGEMPDPVKGSVGGLQPIKELDYNTSLVRDPRYPIALPRIAVSGGIQMRSVFTAKEKIDKVTILSTTKVEQVYSVRPTLLPIAGSSELLEHEGPLLLLDSASDTTITKDRLNDHDEPPLPQGIDPELFTLNGEGQIVNFKASMGTNPVGQWAWSNPTYVLPNEVLSLRRNRALVAVKRSVEDFIDTQVFFIAQDHTLLGTRRLNFASWTVPVSLAGSAALHPFSNLAVVARGNTSVDLFFLDQNGLLSTAWWLTSDTIWPGSNLQTIQKTPTLLLATSIIAVSPSQTSLLVFAIGKDCKLHMASYNTDPRPTKRKDWSGPAPVEGLQDTDSRLFAHAQLDAHVMSPTLVCVATITEINEPCLYQFILEGSRWKLKPGKERLYFPNRPDVKVIGDPASTFEAAPGYSFNPKVDAKSLGYAFNPYGDIKLSMVDGRLMIWIPGVITTTTRGYPGDRSVLLFRRAEDDENEVWKRVK